MILDKIKARGEEMAPLEGHDRLQYIIDEARKVEPLQEKFKTEDVFDLIYSCVDHVYEGEKIYPGADSTSDEKKEFFDSISQKNLVDIRKFFDSIQ